MIESCVTLGRQSLRALTTQAEKAAAWCADHKVEESVMLGSRLYPDMLPLRRQMQIANDFCRRPAARLAGLEAPAQPDDEESFAALIARFAASDAWLASIDPARFDGAETREISFPAGPDRTLKMLGSAYLMTYALPNLYFHAATAHAILRHNGVSLGKLDFLALQLD
jgi:uncharacterized protein